MLIRTAAMAVLMLRGNASRPNSDFCRTVTSGLPVFRYFAMPICPSPDSPTGRSASMSASASSAECAAVHRPLKLLRRALGRRAVRRVFLFCGLLQQWMERWTGNWIAALLVTSALFGSAHLGFHNRVSQLAFRDRRRGSLGLFLRGLASENLAQRGRTVWSRTLGRMHTADIFATLCEEAKTPTLHQICGVGLSPAP